MCITVGRGNGAWARSTVQQAEHWPRSQPCCVPLLTGHQLQSKSLPPSVPQLLHICNGNIFPAFEIPSPTPWDSPCLHNHSPLHKAGTICLGLRTTQLTPSQCHAAPCREHLSQGEPHVLTSLHSLHRSNIPHNGAEASQLGTLSTMPQGPPGVNTAMP